MKTITLAEAYAGATKGPLKQRCMDGSTKFDRSITSDDIVSIATVFAWPGNKVSPITQDECDHNAVLLAHAFNVLPEVVKMLAQAIACIEASLDEVPEETREAMVSDMKRYQSALTKANQVKLP